MKLKVVYQSRSGNTKKVADAIAQSLNQTAEAVPPAYPLENVKLLFLGCGLYGGKLDRKIADFINTLNQSRVKNVALFGTSGGAVTTAMELMRKALKERGINVLEDTYVCKGKMFFFFNRGNPSREDLRAAQEFAKKVVEGIQE